MKKINKTDLVISIVSAELVGAVSALFSGGFVDFYAEIKKPPFSPPSWVFPVVWAILYAVMGLSAYIISKADNRAKYDTLKIYYIQLAVNFSWSIIFFRFRLFRVASVVAVILALLVWLMIYAFKRINRKSGIINIPYLLWSIFASYLTIGTAVLNMLP